MSYAMAVDGKIERLREGEFYGTIVRRAVVSGATISIVRHNHANDLPVHAHDQPYFCLLVEGQYSETYADRTISYQPFSIALHPAKFSHSDCIASVGASFFTIELADEWHERVKHYVDLNNVAVDLAGGDVSWAALRLLREFLEADEPNQLLVEGLLYEMLAAFAALPAEPTAPPWLERIKGYLQGAFAENHTMVELARLANVHPVSLARSFRLHERQTVGDFVNRLRIAQACQLLSDAATRIADIAADCGFVDQSHLTRVFKNITGMTPGVFRSVVLQSRPV
jgi:AraC family transcriptional regulator